MKRILPQTLQRNTKQKKKKKNRGGLKKPFKNTIWKEKTGLPRPPASAKDMSSIPHSRISHAPQSNQAHTPQPLSLRSRAHEPQLPEPLHLQPASTMRRPRITVKSSPCSPQLEKIQEQQQRRRASGKNSACLCWRHRRREFDPRVRKIPWRRTWQPTPVFLPGKSLGQRSLLGYSPWGHKESDSTEPSTASYS